MMNVYGHRRSDSVGGISDGIFVWKPADIRRIENYAEQNVPIGGPPTWMVESTRRDNMNI